jgi:hypothetical protein
MSIYYLTIKYYNISFTLICAIHDKVRNKKIIILTEHLELADCFIIIA